MIDCLHEESTIAVIKALFENDKSYPIVLEMFGDKLHHSLMNIAKIYQEDMTHMYDEDPADVAKIVSEAGKKSFQSDSKDIALLFARLSLSETVFSKATNFFGSKRDVMINFAQGRIFQPDGGISEYNDSHSLHANMAVDPQMTTSTKKRTSSVSGTRRDLLDPQAQRMLCGRLNKLYAIVPFILSVFIHCNFKGDTLLPVLMVFGMMLKLNGGTNVLIDYCSQMCLTHAPGTIMKSLKKTAVMQANLLKRRMQGIIETWSTSGWVILVIYDNYAKLQFNSLMKQGDKLTRIIHTLQFLAVAFQLGDMLLRTPDRSQCWGVCDELSIDEASEILERKKKLDIPDSLLGTNAIRDTTKPSLSKFWVYPCLHGLSSSFLYFMTTILPVLKFIFGMEKCRELFMVVDPEPILLVVKSSWVVAQSVAWLALIPPIFHYQKHLCETLLENVPLSLFIFIPFFEYMDFRKAEFKKVKDALMVAFRKGSAGEFTLPTLRVDAQVGGDEDEGEDDDDVDEDLVAVESSEFLDFILEGIAETNPDIDDNGQPIEALPGEAAASARVESDDTPILIPPPRIFQ